KFKQHCVTSTHAKRILRYNWYVKVICKLKGNNSTHKKGDYHNYTHRTETKNLHLLAYLPQKNAMLFGATKHITEKQSITPQMKKKIHNSYIYKQPVTKPQLVFFGNDTAKVPSTIQILVISLHKIQ